MFYPNHSKAYVFATLQNDKITIIIEPSYWIIAPKPYRSQKSSDIQGLGPFLYTNDFHLNDKYVLWGTMKLFIENSYLRLWQH